MYRGLWAEDRVFVKTEGRTGNIVPVGTIGDALPKIFPRVQLLTRVPFVHQMVLLQHRHTDTHTHKLFPHNVLERASICT